MRASQRAPRGPITIGTAISIFSSLITSISGWTICRNSVKASSASIAAFRSNAVRGACRALGVPGPVTSPTFTIGQRYGGGRLPVSHLDLYRLQTLEGEDPALLEDYLRPEGVAFVEWPGAGSGRLERPALEVRLSHLDEERRRVEVDWQG